MSKGPGHIERTLVALFESNPDGAFSTGELVTAVYGVNRYGAEKKHEVAVLRTARKLTWTGWTSLRGETWGRGLVFYNTGSAYSYGLARLRAEGFAERYGSNRLVSVHARLKGDHADLIARGGRWWMFAQQERAKLGFEIDPETQSLIDVVKAKNDAELAALGAHF
jgi:hypothetical protein